MTLAGKIQYFIQNPNQFCNVLLNHVAPLIRSDKMYLKLKWKLRMDYPLNLENPQTFNEKLQWLKLYDRRPEYTQMVDKVEAKKYVANIIGKEHIIPTLAVYDSAEDIDFDALPNQFVLKCTHDSGGIVVCRDKSKLDREAAIKELSRGLKVNYFFQNREWPYKNVKPRIIAEQYMSNDVGEDLADFKVHNFNGVPEVILVCRDRYKETGLTEDFFNSKWEHLDISRPDHPWASSPIECPKELEEMLRLSEQLAKDIPFVRTDFYTIDHKVYFGEITFYPSSGMKAFVPDVWDRTFGDWVKLPSGGGNLLLIKDNMVFLIKEEKVNADEEELSDYKFFCFDGKPEYMFIATDRFNKDEETKFDFFDMDFNHLPFTNGHPNATRKIEKPRGFDKMKQLATKLSKGIPQVRIDFYDVNGHVYFGEMTFFHWSGMVPFEPQKWDEIFGQWITLPKDLGGQFVDR